ncbi:hypothetical protein KA005_14050 [bacterium]|nr:hypothetical protein [bacterium]
MEYCLFRKLALGARFQYANRQKKVWVKIGANTIAEWDEDQKVDDWIGQQICCFTDTFDTDIYVIVL